MGRRDCVTGILVSSSLGLAAQRMNIRHIGITDTAAME
jgi:hypothetical protein